MFHEHEAGVKKNFPHALRRYASILYGVGLCVDAAWSESAENARNDMRCQGESLGLEGGCVHLESTFVLRSGAVQIGRDFIKTKLVACSLLDT